jgi:hypothetical protein
MRHRPIEDPERRDCTDRTLRQARVLAIDRAYSSRRSGRAEGLSSALKFVGPAVAPEPSCSLCRDSSLRS